MSSENESIKMNKNSLYMIGLILIILIAGYFLFFNKTKVDKTVNIPTIQLSYGDLPYIGNENAKISIIEFSDYQCPFCEKFYVQTEGQIKDNYVKTGKVKFYFRDFPLNLHEKANMMANIARCAGEQGKYWEMHDKLYQTQKSWTGLPEAAAKEQVENYAIQMGVNPDALKTCVDSNKYSDKIQADIKAGTNYGVDGTPTLLIITPPEKVNLQKVKDIVNSNPDYFALAKDQNGNYVVIIVGAQPYSLFSQIFDAIGA